MHIHCPRCDFRASVESRSILWWTLVPLGWAMLAAFAIGTVIAGPLMIFAVPAACAVGLAIGPLWALCRQEPICRRCGRSLAARHLRDHPAARNPQAGATSAWQAPPAHARAIDAGVPEDEAIGSRPALWTGDRRLGFGVIAATPLALLLAAGASLAIESVAGLNLLATTTLLYLLGVSTMVVLGVYSHLLMTNRSLPVTLRYLWFSFFLLGAPVAVLAYWWVHLVNAGDDEPRAIRVVDQHAATAGSA